MLRAALVSCLLAVVPQISFAQEKVPLVKLAEVNEISNEATRQFFGSVSARETVDLAFQVGGQVLALPVIEGAPLAKGDLVAELDLEPFQLALDQAKTQMEQAQRTVERLEKLQGTTVSQVTVDDAQTQLALADIARRNAEYSLNEATLRAPFDALVAARNVAKFGTVAAGTPIVRLHDMSELRIDIDVPEVLFQRAGADPDIKLLAKFPASDKTYPLGLREFNAETSQVGQTFSITLGLAPPNDLVVLPGSSVTVISTIRDGQSSLSVPASAVVTANDGATQAYVFEPAGAAEGSVRKVNIDITPDSNGLIVVTGGLTAGQEVVVSGTQLLKDGDRVRRFTGFSN